MLENRKLHRKKKITETRYKESKYMYICEQDKLKKDFAKVPLKKNLKETGGKHPNILRSEYQVEKNQVQMYQKGI